MNNLIEINLKKLEKKTRKCQHVVARETGVTCTNTPSKNLVICNAGLVNGLSEVDIAANFIQYGLIERILMLPGKSCCFIIFKDINASLEAYKCCSGVLKIAQNNKPIILSFCEEIPMKYLESSDVNLPPGLLILEDFLTDDEEKLLLSLCDFQANEDANNLKFRKVKHFGFEFRYDINNVDKDNPLKENIPEECNFLWKRLNEKQSIIRDFEPNQLTVNHYKPGQGIPSHVDTHSAFEDPLVSVSLGSSIVMEFKHDNGRHVSVLLPQRSLTIISGESRYDWKHGITPRNLDAVQVNGQLNVFHRKPRTSFTFRKVRSGECYCQYKTNCDTYLRNKQQNVDELTAKTLEKTHVYEVYENIASHFSETRHKPWPNVLNFIESLDTGAVLIDVGCGNGKYLGHRKDIYEIGCDRSFNLLEMCKMRCTNIFSCNCLELPLQDEIADAVISIAVIHHLANEDRRVQAVKEIIRILKVNGKGLIYVWAKDQNKNNNKTTYLKQDRKNRKKKASIFSEENPQIDNGFSLPIHSNRSQFKHADVLVPWKLKNASCNPEEVFLRFYHVFQEGELDSLCKKIDNVEIIKSYYDEGNWCVLLKKKLIS